MSTPYKPHLRVRTPSQAVIRELSKAFEVMRNRYNTAGMSYHTTAHPMNDYQAMQYRLTYKSI